MTNINIISLFTKTTVPVKITIFILIFFSIVSWTIIIQKFFVFNSVKNKSKNFEKKFWSNIELSTLYKSRQSNQNNLIGLEKIFFSGFKEFTRLHLANSNLIKDNIEGSYRAMFISINKELEYLEIYIPFLYIIGSISPYIGLFGTVCGIINSFVILNNVTQISLQMISPGITESLLATATGLFSAIPAVTACNYFNQKIKEMEIKYNNFMEEFTMILYRRSFINQKYE